MTSSVALCTYNGETYIAEQLDSILSQTSPVSEVIICDDGSTDGTLEVLSRYVKQYPEIIKVYQNPENLGYVGNFEKAMSLCSGDIVLLCDQDDRWYNNKIKAVTEIFKNHKNINVICHNIRLFGEFLKSSEAIVYWQMESFDPENFTKPGDILKRLLYQGNVFPGMSMAIRNVFLKTHLPLKRVNSVIIHDYELLLLAADQSSLWVEKNILGEYRIHPKQNIGYKAFSEFNASEVKTISREDLFKVFQRYPFVKKVVSELNLNINLNAGYVEYCHHTYKDYLKKLPLPDRLVNQIKMKYYFHIFDYLK
ncbi:glycosyl transferase family 2 [Chryseobacterium sp. 52]|uniref:glycosyltransferase n=1 Tax=Chryseobacterium sp. 52 TaxID=2035213 RepID=UPI000C18F4CD|nr:glycosyltransferase [Chryseobacterium sp. 52]PIF43415.1 glycosyl transferase family 2 [Chryseobacterium sp. 52]